MAPGPARFWERPVPLGIGLHDRAIIAVIDVGPTIIGYLSPRQNEQIGIVGKGGCSVEVPVIIEQVSGSGYRANGAGGLSVGLTAEGATAAEAIDRLAEQVRPRVNAGATLAELRNREKLT